MRPRKRDTIEGAAPHARKLRRHLEEVADPSEVSEIVAAEAFRLSRDGVIQHHFALTRSSPLRQSAADSKGGASGSKRRRPGLRRGSSPHKPGTWGDPQSDDVDYSSLARYYRECSQRPKGYRRLVVASSTRVSDISIPDPPTDKKADFAASLLRDSVRSKHEPSEGEQRREVLRKDSTNSTYAFESIVPDLEDEGERKDEHEDPFNNVEYQYVSDERLVVD